MVTLDEVNVYRPYLPGLWSASAAGWQCRSHTIREDHFMVTLPQPHKAEGTEGQEEIAHWSKMQAAFAFPLRIPLLKGCVTSVFSDEANELPRHCDYTQPPSGFKQQEGMI